MSRAPTPSATTAAAARSHHKGCGGRIENDRAAEALPLLEAAASVSGAPAEVRYHLAVAQAKAGKRDEARAGLRKLLEGPAFAQAADARKLLAELGPP